MTEENLQSSKIRCSQVFWSYRLNIYDYTNFRVKPLGTRKEVRVCTVLLLPSKVETGDSSSFFLKSNGVKVSILVLMS